MQVQDENAAINITVVGSTSQAFEKPPKCEICEKDATVYFADPTCQSALYIGHQFCTKHAKEFLETITIEE